MFSIETGYGWKAIHGLEISGLWKHSSTTPFLSDGIGDYLKTQIETSKFLFSVQRTKPIG